MSGHKKPAWDARNVGEKDETIRETHFDFLPSRRPDSTGSGKKLTANPAMAFAAADLGSD